MVCRVLMACLCVSVASANPLSVDSERKWSWGENVGFMNWRDAGSPVGAQGAMLFPDVLAGYVWCENIGYVNLGDGSPANGMAYSNTSGVDHGVNIAPDGRLSGLAWGENVGWINFDTFAVLAGQGLHARFDRSALRLMGYAWAENIGWVNLNDAQHYVAFNCPADFNADGFLDFFDFDDFVTCFESGVCPPGRSADIDGDGFVDFFDFDEFIAAFEAGC